MNKDYRLGGLVGFLAGLCLIPIVMNLGYKSIEILAILPIAGGILISFGVFLGRVLSRIVPVMFQLSKFAAVGILNTAINFAVLNLLSLATGVEAGLSVGGYNLPATGIAAANSYFWNKYWVFGGVSRGSISDPPKFIVVTIIGYIVRSSILVGMTSAAHGAITDALWLNISNVAATVVGIMVDFLGYKFLVFVKKK